MSERNFVWAIDENGKPCRCYAKPENRGKRNCKHRFHQEPGQSSEDFFKQHGYDAKKTTTNVNDTKHSESIFREDKIEVLPYRLTDEDKSEMLKIECKKDLTEECDNGAYIELDEPLWNDMDRNAFESLTGFKAKDTTSVLHEEKYIVLNDTPDHKAGDVVEKEEADELSKAGYNVGTGLETMNAYAAKNGFTATKDVYVLPYYMRAGVPDGEGGEIPSDETALYLHLFSTKRYSNVNRQLAYEALISAGEDRSYYKKKPLSDRLRGKSGVWRKEITGGTIPYAGRAVAVPDTTISYDEVRIPPSMAVDIFKPTIEKSLQDRGFTPAQINEVIRDAKRRQESVDPITKNLIQNAMDNGNVRVILNRQPTLHSASMQGFRPKLSNSATVGVNPLVAAGFNLDHDGDTCSCIGINNSEISREVDSELHPSNFKYTPRKQDELNMKPTKDSLWGIMNVLKRRSN